MAEKRAAQKAQMGLNWGAYAPVLSSLAVPFASAGLSSLVGMTGLTTMLADLGLPASFQTALNTGINNIMPGIAAQGVNAALGMLQSGAGNVAAAGNTVSGTGAGTIGQMTGGGTALNNVVSAVNSGLPGATAAGATNILNSGAAAGLGGGTLLSALGVKEGEFPWLAVLLGLGGAAAVTTVIIVASGK
jgi:hypothetical protein